MKKTLALLLITSIMTTGLVQSQDIAIPKIESPAALQEGTQRELSASQIAELLPWAKDSKIFLIDLLDHALSLPMDQRIDRLVDGIKSVVVESAPKQSELVMRYALNRALVINGILEKESDATQVGSSDAQARVLVASVKLALKYYDSDMANLSNKTALPYAAFGIEYFEFLNELNKSIFDASAQYNIQRTALEFLQWDLYRDLNNTKYASQIVKINNSLKIFPDKKMVDTHSINYIRQMKKTVEQLDLVKKKDDVKTADVIATPKTTVNGKYGSFYSSYYGTSYCYPVDKSGAKLGDSAVDIKNCQTQYISTYSSYYGTSYCYPADKDGKKLGDSAADIAKCKADYKSIYSSYYGTNYCYPVDRAGNKLGDSAVDISLCQ